MRKHNAMVIHVINPVCVSRQSDLYIAQPITFASIHNAIACASKKNIEVKIVAACYEEDIDFAKKYLPEAKICQLHRSAQDFMGKNSRKLPLLQEIIDTATNEADSCQKKNPLIVYTNIDISLQPHFYIECIDLYSKSPHPFTINRRTISKKYSHPKQLTEMYADPGEKHPGHDCFVFNLAIAQSLNLGNAVIGANWIGRVLLSNLMALSQSFKTYSELHLTFHIGDDRSWQASHTQEISMFNEMCLISTLKYWLHQDNCCNRKLLQNFISQHTSRLVKLQRNHTNNYSHVDTVFLEDTEEIYEFCLSGFQQVIFLVGHPRSGTTFLQSVLASNSQEFVSIPETHYFNHILKSNDSPERIESAPSKDLKKLTDTIRERVPFSTQAETLLVKLAENKQLSRSSLFNLIYCDNCYRLKEKISDFKHKIALEKTPDHIHFVDQICSVFPGSKFINIVRSPFATIESRIKAFWWENYDIDKYISLWRASVNAAITQTRNGRSMMSLRYEDLVHAPSETLLSICKFLQVSPFPYDPAQVAVNAKKLVLPWENWKENNLKGFRPQSSKTSFYTSDAFNVIFNSLQPELAKYSYLSKTYYDPLREIRWHNKVQKKLNIRDGSRPKALLVDHVYHQKTGSSNFFAEYLQSIADLETIYIDPASPVQLAADQWSKLNYMYDIAVFWQISPFNPHFSSKPYVALVQAHKFAFVPMYDAEGPYSKFKKFFFNDWNLNRNVHIISYSSVIHRLLSRAGANSTYLQFAPESSTVNCPKPLSTKATDKPTVLFVYRKPEIGWNIVKSLLDPNQIHSVYIHHIPDRPEFAMEPLSEDDISRYNVVIGEWLPSSEDFEKILDQHDIVIMPRLYEGIGMLLVESLAKGKCVIAPNAPTANEYIVDRHNGLLYDINDPPGVIDVSAYKQIGRNAQLHIQKLGRRHAAHLPAVLKKQLFDPLAFFTFSNRVLLVFPHNIFVTDSGVKTRFLKIVSWLHANKFEVDLLAFSNWCDAWPSDVSQYSSRHLFREIFLYDFSEYCKHEHSSKPGSFIPDFCSPKLKEEVRRLQSIYKYGTVLVSYAHWASVCESLHPARSILFVEDLLHNNIASRRGMSDTQMINSTRQDEYNRLSCYPEVVFISEKEQKLCEPYISSTTKTYYLPHPIEKKSKDAAGALDPEQTLDEKLNLIFVGSDNPFNVEGIKWFLSKVCPLMGELPYRLQIIGRVCEFLDVDKIDPHIRSRVILKGYVENLADEYRCADLSISPLLGGTGAKIKVLESLSHGVPVVGLLAGLDGIPHSQPGIKICANQNEFSKVLSDYFFDPSVKKQTLDLIFKHSKNEEDEIFSRTIKCLFLNS